MSFIDWVLEPFNKPQLELTTIDEFRICLTIIVGFIIIVGIVGLVAFILEKIGVIK